MIQFAAFDGVGIGDHNPGALPLRDAAGCWLLLLLAALLLLPLLPLLLRARTLPDGRLRSDRLAFASCKLLSCGWWGRTHGILDMLVSAEPLEVRQHWATTQRPPPSTLHLRF